MSEKVSKKRKFDFSLLARIISLAAPYKKLFALTIILAITVAPVSMLRPYIVSVMVDDYILHSDLPGLYKMAVVFVIVVFLTVLLRYLMIYFSSLLGQSVIRSCRKAFMLDSSPLTFSKATFTFSLNM